ncbi:MAG: hypothetical protein ACE15B_10045 [Bryobacteraceae bacterium]
MDTVLIGATLVGSFATAFLLQKAALHMFFRAMETDRRDRG